MSDKEIFAEASIYNHYEVDDENTELRIWESLAFRECGSLNKVISEFIKLNSHNKVELQVRKTYLYHSDKCFSDLFIELKENDISYLVDEIKNYLNKIFEECKIDYSSFVKLRNKKFNDCPSRIKEIVWLDAVLCNLEYHYRFGYKLYLKCKLDHFSG